MGRKIRITEEQYNMALKEGVTINADLGAANNDPKKHMMQRRPKQTNKDLKVENIIFSSQMYRNLSLLQKTTSRKQT